MDLTTVATSSFEVIWSRKEGIVEEPSHERPASRTRSPPYTSESRELGILRTSAQNDDASLLDTKNFREIVLQSVFWFNNFRIFLELIIQLQNEVNKVKNFTRDLREIFY